MKNPNTDINYLGETFGKLLSEHFQSVEWVQKSYDRNKDEVLVLLEKLTVMKCSGYDNSFSSQLILKLDLYKISEYNPGYKKIIKSFNNENRYYIFNAKFFFQETLRDLNLWDLDVPAYLIQEFIKIAQTKKQ